MGKETNPKKMERIRGNKTANKDIVCGKYRRFYRKRKLKTKKATYCLS